MKRTALRIGSLLLILVLLLGVLPTAALADEPSIQVETDATSQRPYFLGDKVTVGIRPEYLSIGGAQAALERFGGDKTVTLNFKSDVVERLGNNTYLYGTSCGQDNFKIIIPGDVQVHTGREVELNCLAKNCLLFNEAGERIYAREEEKQPWPEAKPKRNESAA